MQPCPQRCAGDEVVQNQHPLIQNLTIQLAMWLVSGNVWRMKEDFNFIISSRRDVTRSTHSSDWNKWASWCAELNVDLVRWDVNWILDLLPFLYESAYENRAICTHRSAFQLCIITLREDLSESKQRSVLLLQVCSFIHHFRPNIAWSRMFSWYWITWKKNFETLGIYLLNLCHLKLLYYWLWPQHPE